MGNLDKTPKETKFKVGDWVYYRDTLYQIDAIGKDWLGLIYVLRQEWCGTSVSVEEGDKYFRKA